MKINVGMVWFNKDTKKFYLERDLDLGASFIVPKSMNISGEDVINVDDLITTYNTSKWVSMPIMEFMLRYADNEIEIPDLLKYLRDNNGTVTLADGCVVRFDAVDGNIFKIAHMQAGGCPPSELVLGVSIIDALSKQNVFTIDNPDTWDDIKETAELLVVKDIQCLLEHRNESPVIFDKLKICFFAGEGSCYSEENDVAVQIENYIKYNLLYTKNKELEEALWLSKDRKGDKRAMRVWADAILTHGGITENELDLAKIVAGLYEKYRD